MSKPVMRMSCLASTMNMIPLFLIPPSHKVLKDPVCTGVGGGAVSITNWDAVGGLGVGGNGVGTTGTGVGGMGVVVGGTASIISM